MPLRSRHSTRPAGQPPDQSAPPVLRPVPVDPPSVTFAHAVRAVGQVARHRGLQVPVFRSPPTLPEVDRTLRRTATGHVVVAVRLAGRPPASIQADVVDGVVAANGLVGREAAGLRRAAWAALGGSSAPRAACRPPTPVRSGPEAGSGSTSDARVA